MLCKVITANSTNSSSYSNHSNSNSNSNKVVVARELLLHIRTVGIT